MEYLKHETSLLRTSVWLLLSVKRVLAHCHQHYKSKYNKKIDLATVGILNLSSDKKKYVLYTSFRSGFFAEYVLAKVTQHPLVPSFLVNSHSRWRTRQQHAQGSWHFPT